MLVVLINLTGFFWVSSILFRRTQKFCLRTPSLINVAVVNCICHLMLHRYTTFNCNSTVFVKKNTEGCICLLLSLCVFR